ncbi:MAG TPA: nitroreductase/quinone reductase family protein [Solirubrobacteraceae bacterium]
MPSDHTLSRFSMSLPAGVLRTFGKWNVPLYRLTRGRVGGKVGSAPVLLLTTTGRRSGQQRTAPVLYMRDGSGLVVIGSNAGNRNEPAWSLNLKANQEATVEVGADRKAVRARVTSGDERQRLWDSMNRQYEGFEDYDERTSRDIAVFLLEPH